MKHKYLYLLMACLSSVSNLSAQWQPNVDIDAAAQAIIDRENVDLGNDTRVSKHPIAELSTNWMAGVTGKPMVGRAGTFRGAAHSAFWYADSETPGSILVAIFPSVKEARFAAFWTLVSIEEGRTGKGYSISISRSFGDLSINPKIWDSDPHGFDTANSDKTFVIFARSNVLVVVDSECNLEPKIPVLDIARGIDRELQRTQTANQALPIAPMTRSGI